MASDAIRRTPLESWIALKLGVSGERLGREHIERYQLERLRHTVEWAHRRGRFYRGLLAGAAHSESPQGSRPRDRDLLDLASFADLRRLPFTTALDLGERGPEFLCVSQDDVGRVVTLNSSGTTGTPKRLCFTVDDQELTVDFFRVGMSTLTAPGDRVSILLPGEVPGSVGDLLAMALRRSGVTPIPHGFVRDLPAAVDLLRRERPTALVGVPVQVLALARYAEEVAGESFRLKSVLLASDHVPDSIVRELERAWGCQVFEHYGMTEMGLGGGVDCEAHAGYHLREADLYVEIVDPLTGEALPEGARGEVVFTTLTRRGMPLIRYRTGDLSRFLPEPCSCGTVLRRLERVRGRLAGRPAQVTMPELDEALFAVPGVVDFTVVASRDPSSLAITAWSLRPARHGVEGAVHEALDRVPAICAARRVGALSVTVSTACVGERLSRGPEKRTIAEAQAMVSQ
jgi:phenylacetate-coenzyme A ligase PaaK-like adenylate-forming protein